MRKATAFRGRSEQDRSALCPACCFLILETFRWNVSNGIFLSRNQRTRHAVSLQDESYHYFVAEIQNVSRETFFVRDIPLKISFTVLWTRTPHFFFPRPIFPQIFFTGNLLLFSPKRAILFSISRVPFSAPERRFFYEALRRHLALGTGACRGAGR